MVLTTAVGLMMGVQVMTARLRGEGRGDEVGAVLRRGMVYALQIGLVSMIALMLLGPFGLMHMGLEDGLGEGRLAGADGLRPVDAGLSDFGGGPVLS